MLHANKQDVEADLRREMLQIRERELKYYASNCRTMGTQATVFAGFAFAFFTNVATGVEKVASIEERASKQIGTHSHRRAEMISSDTPELLRVLFVLCCLTTMTLNISAMFFANCLALFGPGLALRGEGAHAMDRAVDGLALEYRVVILIFFSGLFSLFVVSILYSLMLNHWAAVVTTSLTLVYLLSHALRAFKRLYKRFRISPAYAQSSAFNADGSRALDCVVQAAQVAALSRHAQWLERLSRPKRLHSWPLRQYLYVRLFFDDFIGVSNEVFEMRYTRARDEVAADGVADVVLERIASLRQGAERSVDLSPAVHRAFSVEGSDSPSEGDSPPGAHTATGALRLQPWSRLGRGAGSVAGDGRGLLGRSVQSETYGSSSGGACRVRRQSSLAPLEEHLPPGDLRPAGGAGTSAEHAADCGYASHSGQESCDGTCAVSSKPPGWDVGGWIVQQGEAWLQKI